MDDGERDDLVAEVADALTLDQDVDWDRCRRQATPANRRSLDNLRLVAGVFSGSQAAEGASASAATNLQPFAGVFVRRAMQALMAFRRGRGGGGAAAVPVGMGRHLSRVRRVRRPAWRSCWSGTR